MKLFRYPFIVVCVVASWFSGVEILQAQPASAYQQGMEQLYRGDVNEALAFWEANYAEHTRVDARIGFEYMRIVTERNFDERFETATEMYYQALLNGTGANSRIAVRQEIERLKPIVGDGMYRQWTDWWDKEKTELRSDIRGYWIRLDPTPARAVNERLIEHWQRIAEVGEGWERWGKVGRCGEVREEWGKVGESCGKVGEGRERWRRGKVGEGRERWESCFNQFINRPEVFSTVTQRFVICFLTDPKSVQQLFQQTQTFTNSFSTAPKCLQHLFNRCKVRSTVFQQNQRVFNNKK